MASYVPPTPKLIARQVTIAIGIFENNSSYSVAVDGHVIGSIDFINNSFENNTFEFNFEGHNYMINVTSNNITTIQHFVNSQEGNFIDFRTIYDVS